MARILYQHLKSVTFLGYYHVTTDSYKFLQTFYQLEVLHGQWTKRKMQYLVYYTGLYKRNVFV